MNSLRGRLTLVLVTALLASGLLAGVGLYWQAFDEFNEQFDSELLAVSNNLSAEALPNLKVPTIAEVQEDDDVVVQLWNTDGRLAYHSDEEVAPFPRLLRGPEVLSTATDAWNSYSRKLNDGRLLQVAQPESARREMAVGSAFQLLVPLLVVVPLLALLVTWLIARQLEPLIQLASHLRLRSSDDDSPLSLPSAPTELSPVVLALNQLFTRQADAANQQRAFLSEAAHELRTPVAVVKLQAERARHAATHGERLDTLATLESGIDRLAHVVAQLLSLARSEVQAASEARKQVLRLDLKLKEWLATLYPLAQAKDLDLGLTQADVCQVFGDASGLESLVFNLVQNAISYTPERGQINVSLISSGGGAAISVSDTGPGIDASQRETMFQRFVRGVDTTTSGAGLGLAIAREQATRHRGTVELLGNTTGPGITARVILPLFNPSLARTT